MTLDKLSFKSFIIQAIIKNPNIGKFYSKKQTNSKYKLADIIDDIIYVLKTGIPWRALKSHINWRSVYFHFNRFVNNDIFKQLYLDIRLKYFINNKTSIQIIDSTFISNKYGKNTIARNIFFKNKNCNKISYLTDVNGIPLSVLINKGNIHDNKFIDEHINDIYFINRRINKSNILLADKAYEGKNIRTFLCNNKYKLYIPKKKNSKIVYDFDKILYKKRINVEHTFQKLKTFRRVNIRYDSNFCTFCSFIYLATFIIIFNAI